MMLDGAMATLDEIRALALTNYGHFTSMLAESGRVRGLSLHLERLARDSRQLFDTDLDLDHVRHLVRKSITDDVPTTVIRVTVFDPNLDLGTIGGEAEPRVLITTRPGSATTPKPQRLQAATYSRELPHVKHIGLFGALQKRRAAQRAGYDDVLFLNTDGSISEIATSNIGFVRDDTIIWPRSAYLAGITMTLLQQALDEPIATEPLTLSDMAQMEASFATNAATGVRAILSVDDTRWPSADHPALARLRELYAEIPAEAV